MAKYDLAEIIEAYRRKWEEHRTHASGYAPVPYKCAECKDTGFIDLYPSNPRKSAEGKIRTVIYCPYCRMTMLRDISGIIAEYRELDIKNFPWGTYGKPIGNLKKTVENFVYDFREWQNEGMGLYIYSRAKGSGKTMVANAICGSICSRHNIAARFTKVEDFLDNVKKTYDSRSKNELSRVDIQKYYETDLLVLDDLGVTKITEWGQGVLHDLINERYKAGRLCIITSNFDLENLPVHPATVDRINDMCMLLHWPEEPIRAMKAEERKNKMRKYVDSYDKFTDVSGGTPFEGGACK